MIVQIWANYDKLHSTIQTIKAKPMQADFLALLRLMQLADSALPIGTTAHSFGLETLVAEGDLDVEQLAPFLRDYLEEAGGVESAFCRLGHRLAFHSDQD